MQKLSIKITSIAKTLSSYSGLHLFSGLISKFEFQALVVPFFPKGSESVDFRAFRSFIQDLMDLLLTRLM
jgi:hypothetical protein